MSAPSQEHPSSPPETQAPFLHRADLWSGLLCLAFGCGVLWIGADYPLGTGGRIGPGYVPRLLAVVLLGTGALLLVRAPFVREGIELVFRARPVVLVLAAVLAFAAAFAMLGLVPAVLVCVLIANFATAENGWQSAVGVGITLALFSWLLFVVALKLPMPVFRF